MKIVQQIGLKKLLQGSPAYGDLEERTVYIDVDVPAEQKKLIIIHEILEIWLHKRIKHSTYDKIAMDIIDTLIELGEIK